MKKLFFVFLALLVMVPSLSIKTADAQVSDTPVWIYAPAISLSSPIKGVGTTASGEMAVPAGSSNNVGWYKNGVTPGDTGTAVLDAHVFAAFKNLAKLPVGSSIYVYMSSGKVLHYVTTKAKTYALSALSPLTLFTPTNSKQLNLITCAGNLTADRTTYDHRLIVSAQLI